MSLYLINTHSGKEIFVLAKNSESAEKKFKKHKCYKEGYSIMEASLFYEVIGSKE